MIVGTFTHPSPCIPEEQKQLRTFLLNWNALPLDSAGPNHRWTQPNLTELSYNAQYETAVNFCWTEQNKIELKWTEWNWNEMN